MQTLHRLVIWLIITLSGALFSNSASGQATTTLTGSVTDGSTGEDLIGANILVQETSGGAATNAYGRYTLPLSPGTYTLIVRYIGYASQERTVNLTESQTLDIELMPQTAELEGVEITVAAVTDQVGSLEMGTAALDIRAVKQVPVVLGEVDVIKTLELLPGVTRTSESAGGFNVRGGGGDQNLVLLDESPIYNASHLFGFFSVFNGDVVKDVKLYKGAIPSRYGGRLSSVLDIRQRDGSTKGYGLSGGIGLISSRLAVEGPIDGGRGSFIVAGRRSYADLFLVLAGNNNRAFFNDLNLKANYRLTDKDRVYLSGYFGRDRFEVGDILGNSWGNAAFTLRWNRLYSERLFSNLSLIYSDYDYAFDILGGGASFRRTAHIRNAHLKSDLTYVIDENTTLDFGLSSIFYDFQPGEIRPLENSAATPFDLDEKFALEPAAYAGLSRTVSSKLKVEVGIRASAFWRLGAQSIQTYEGDQPVLYDDQFGRYRAGLVTGVRRYGSGETIKSFAGLEPRISARYQLSDVSSVKASANRTRQYLHLISNTTAISPLDVWAPSGPYLEPQQADQVSLGYFRTFDNNRYEASVEGYYRSMENQVDYVDGAELQFNNALETELLSGKGRAYGLELFVRKQEGALTGWLSYTLSKTERRIPGVSALDPGVNGGDWYPANYDKPQEFSATLAYRLNEKWTLSANFVYASGRPITYPASRYTYGPLSVAQFQGRNQQRLPAYHRLDLAASLDGFLGGNWTFSLYNAYNRKNASSIFFRPTESNPNVSEAVRIALFGVVPGITYNF